MDDHGIIACHSFRFNIFYTAGRLGHGGVAQSFDHFPPACCLADTQRVIPSRVIQWVFNRLPYPTQTGLQTGHPLEVLGLRL